MSTPCAQPPSSPCSPCAAVDNTNICGQTLSTDDSTGDLFITPNGNSVNLCNSVQTCQTQTILQGVSLIGTSLQIVYIGENGVAQYANVNLAPLVEEVTASFTAADSNSIDLTYAGGTLTASLVVDPASTIPISASSSGVLFSAPPVTPITITNSNTIDLIASGLNGYHLTANVNYHSSGSILINSNSMGLYATALYSTDAGNVALSGSDGGIYVQSLASQLSGYPQNGVAQPTTLLLGSDGKLYLLPTQIIPPHIVGISTNSISLTTFSDGHTIQADARVENSNSINLAVQSGGIQATLNLSATGNVPLTVVSDGLAGTITTSTINNLYPNALASGNTMVKAYGIDNNNNPVNAPIKLTPNGPLLTSLTTTQRLAIASGDLHDGLLVFDNVVRGFFWYDAVGLVWVQLT